MLRVLLFYQPVTWGSGNAYRLPSSFREDTPVKVEIEATDQILLNMPTCQECESQPNLSSIMDCIKAVNWRQIHSFNLTSIVKCKFAFVVV
jgi:hypothetical protein